MTQDTELIEAGNIDLSTRPFVKNADGTVSNIRSMSVEIDGAETLLPTVADDGRIMRQDEAIAHYLKTGKHLGKFKSAKAATAYAVKLHNEQEAAYLASLKKVPIGPP